MYILIPHRSDTADSVYRCCHSWGRRRRQRCLETEILHRRDPSSSDHFGDKRSRDHCCDPRVLGPHARPLDLPRGPWSEMKEKGILSIALD